MHVNCNYGNTLGNKGRAILVNQKAKQRITFPQKKVYYIKMAQLSTCVTLDNGTTWWFQTFESFDSILGSSRKPSRTVWGADENSGKWGPSRCIIEWRRPQFAETS